MSPNQEHVSVMLSGVGKLRMASRYFLHGRMLSGVISNPANSMVCSEYKLVWIEGDAVVSAEVQPVDCLGEAFAEVVWPEQSVVDAFGLVGNVGDNFIKSS